MSELRGVIFDKDGTLFDFSKTWEAWAASLLRRLSQSETQAAALARAVGFHLDQRRFDPDSIAIAGTPNEIASALMPHLADYSVGEIISIINEEASNAPQMEVVALRPFINDLRQSGYLLGVVTNDAEQPARAHLDAAGITALFDFVAGSDSGWGAKPEPGQLMACARAMAMDPREIVMVGDSTHDLIAAKRAGMRGIGVLTGMADADVLLPHAEEVLPHIGHLPGWLRARSSA